MVSAVIAFAHNDMQMCFAPRLRRSDALFEHIFRFFDEQAVQVDGIASDAISRVVLAEDEVARLAIVLVHLRCMLLALFAQLMGAGAVAR